MKSSFAVALAVLSLVACQPEKASYSSITEYPSYENENLWPRYSPEGSTFKLYSPLAEAAQIHFYQAGSGGEAIRTEAMMEKQAGLWLYESQDDLKGLFYTYQVQVNGIWQGETPGIYATAVGVNGERAAVIDLAETNPQNWKQDQTIQLNSPNEAIIYELHVRDLSTHPSAGISAVGKYLGLVEAGTKSPDGLATGIDHMKELGITHVHLLPAFDHYSIREEKLDSPQFNWGYDPQNYNVPEGSYSSNPHDPLARIREFKQMVQAFHQAGIGVILDVVYNHTGRTDDSNFNKELPAYYYRQNADGTWSDASACGNETASERPMMRKFMKESLIYWAQEYHLDGFRFDLMGIHDIETMNEIADTLKKINPSILLYGEGWTAGGSPLPDEQKALKRNTWQMPKISAFSDDLRDGLKGSVFDDASTGFVSGAADTEESIKFGVVGAIPHPQISYKKVNYSDTSWAAQPWQAIGYVSCHDNHTLYDKLLVSRPDASAELRQQMHLLANAIVLTSQSIPFLHAGVEMMRTKGGEHNSYNKPDAINQINWNWKQEHAEVFAYYQALIALRKLHPAFAMPSTDMVQKHLRFFDNAAGLMGYQISDNANGDAWKDIVVYYNGNTTAQKVALEGEWTLAVEGNEIKESGIRKVKNSVEVPALSMLIAYRK
ncbi:type I pullulanase [Cytophagales bacterium LB-30]|uniref:Type I pullulanase n=1 Tax=Shiella aurantiaca TaxID=3058365 RepID=A0ABT8F6H2_9BACT|nr:type I pullulanase [Shiella aurantiaca]MDN4166045.1 type I pullulanase [Shiella aurantiaca]